jgi:thiamine transporter ThiT
MVMNPAKTNYWIDIGMGIAFMLSLITGIIKWPRLITWFGLTYSQLPMKAISAVHDWSGIIMGLLVLVHLLLHRKWISCMTRQFFNKKEEKKCEPR